MTRPRAELNLTLPIAPERYDQKDQANMRQQIETLAKKVTPLQQKQVVTGAKGGNAALTNLLTALANLGLISDSTT